MRRLFLNRGDCNYVHREGWGRGGGGGGVAAPLVSSQLKVWSPIILSLAPPAPANIRKPSYAYVECISILLVFLFFLFFPWKVEEG